MTALLVPTTVTLHFTVVGTPVAQGSKRAFSRGAKVVLVESSADTLGPWRDAVAKAALAARPTGWPMGRAYVVDLAFSFGRPKAHYSSRGLIKVAAPSTKTTKPDGDKLERAILDALTGVAWVDDAQVVELRWRKRWAEVPGVAVQVTEVLP